MEAPNQLQQEGGVDDADVVDYIKDAKACSNFLEKFENSSGERKYQKMLQEITEGQRKILEVDLNDLISFDDDSDKLVENILENTNRYMDLFAKAADDFMDLMNDPNDQEMNDDMDSEERLHRYRRAMYRQELESAQNMQNQQQQNEAPPGDDNEGEPAEDEALKQIKDQLGLSRELLRRYEVVIIPPAKVQSCSLRQVDSNRIGSLVKIRGIVTRVSDVKPKVVIAAYLCDTCHSEVYQKVPSTEFLPLHECKSPLCMEASKPGRVNLNTRFSKLVKFQEIKLQESPDQVPIGHIPRTLSIHCRGTATRQCSPGDTVDLVGVFLPLPTNAFRQMKMGLIHNTYVECQSITRHKKSYAELSNEISVETEAEIDRLQSDSNYYDKLAKSIAPEIFGEDDVKKILLLQLVGGVTKKMRDGLSIRGDINVLLMGDPGVAKSQLLKFISSIAPRGVYTTGKGSSGVGLTAAVIRDKSTGDVALEGGALVLADQGICCIDEFDKMDDTDRTAIHEVMEQQTVSIAKAGVTTTLNARTSILAAANPVLGRYNKNLSPEENIGLPAALYSRFDMCYLLVDTPNSDRDAALAKHITFVHKHSSHPTLDFEPLTPQLLRAYVSQARSIEPTIPPTLTNLIVDEYVEMRQKDQQDAEQEGKRGMLTARQLLSILRMAQALARIRFDEVVQRSDIMEAIRLVRACRQSLEIDDDNEDENGRKTLEDTYTRIYDILRTHAHKSGDTTSFKYSDIEPIVLAKGYSTQALRNTLQRYQELNVIHVNASHTRITFVSN